MIATFPELRFMDNRPVQEIDRGMAEAFMRGGPEEERKWREEFNTSRDAKHKAKIQQDIKVEDEARAKRKATFRMMCDDLKKKKQNADLVKDYEETQEEMENINIDNTSDKVFKQVHKNMSDKEKEILQEWSKANKNQPQ